MQLRCINWLKGMPTWLNWQSSWFVISRLSVQVRLSALMDGFPSGQRGQTVNLLASPSKVRIPRVSLNVRIYYDFVVDLFLCLRQMIVFIYSISKVFFFGLVIIWKSLFCFFGTGVFCVFEVFWERLAVNLSDGEGSTVAFLSFFFWLRLTVRVMEVIDPA